MANQWRSTHDGQSFPQLIVLHMTVTMAVQAQQQNIVATMRLHNDGEESSVFLWYYKLSAEIILVAADHTLVDLLQQVVGTSLTHSPPTGLETQTHTNGILAH